MTSTVLNARVSTFPLAEAARDYLVLAGRFLFALIFIQSAPAHFSAATIGYAAQQGVPFASFLVPASGVLALVGGLSVAIGYQARLGALLLIAFLVPVTFALHNFWAMTDPMMAQLQRAMFLKNVSMLGAALVIVGLGAGPKSVDALRDDSNAWR